MNRQPTDVELKEFWEWCEAPIKDIMAYDVVSKRYYPDKLYPQLDLNNLFKWAVPKLIEKGLGCTVAQDALGSNACTYMPFATAEDGVNSEAKSNDPVLALFWAIWEVIHEN